MKTRLILQKLFQVHCGEGGGEWLENPLNLGVIL